MASKNINGYFPQAEKISSMTIDWIYDASKH